MEFAYKQQEKRKNFLKKLNLFPIRKVGKRQAMTQ